MLKECSSNVHEGADAEGIRFLSILGFTPTGFGLKQDEPLR